MSIRSHWPAIVFALMLLAFALFWFVLPSQASAHLVHPDAVRSASARWPSKSPSDSPALSVNSSFTLSLPLLMNGTASPANPCAPGQTITDPATDVAPAYIDVTSLSTNLSEQRLTATLYLRDVPPQLTFDRPGVPQSYTEYDWAIYVDVDNNPLTGSGLSFYKGADLKLGAYYPVQSPGASITEPISDAVNVRVWQYIGSNTWRPISDATLVVDPQGDTMTLSGDIPGTTSASRLIFYTYDYNPGGARLSDTSSCAIVPSSAAQ